MVNRHNKTNLTYDDDEIKLRHLSSKYKTYYYQIYYLYRAGYDVTTIELALILSNQSNTNRYDLEKWVMYLFNKLKEEEK